MPISLKISQKRRYVKKKNATHVIIKNALVKNAKTIEKMARNTREVAMPEGRTLGLKYFQTVIQYGIVLIAKIDKNIIGFLLAEVYDITKISVLTYLVVDSKYRTIGIGTKLINYYLNQCKKRKIKLVNLFSPKFNKKTLKFYKNLGFKKDKEYVLFFKDL